MQRRRTNKKEKVKVERTGLEPVTSALSKQRSEPTELTFRAGKFKDDSISFADLFLPEIFLNNFYPPETL